MTRNVQVVLLCEDRQQEVFARRFLKKTGWNTRELRVEKAPHGRGAGEQYVRDRFPTELADFRRRAVRSKALSLPILTARPLMKRTACTRACPSRVIVSGTSIRSSACVSDNNCGTLRRLPSSSRAKSMSGYAIRRDATGLFYPEAARCAACDAPPTRKAGRLDARPFCPAVGSVTGTPAR